MHTITKISKFQQYSPLKEGAVVSCFNVSFNVFVAGLEFDMWVIGDCHVGRGEGNVINYLMRCSACRDFIMLQNRNKFAMNNRRRYIHKKGRLTMVDVNTGDI